YLDYTLSETLQQLKPWWRKALESGQSLAADNPAGRDFLLRTIHTPELLKLPRSEMVLQAILTRTDAADADRMVALGDLAKARNQSLVAVLMEELEAHLKAAKSPSTNYQSPINSLARLLPYQIP